MGRLVSAKHHVDVGALRASGSGMIFVIQVCDVQGGLIPKQRISRPTLIALVMIDGKKLGITQSRRNLGIARQIPSLPLPKSSLARFYEHLTT